MNKAVKLMEAINLLLEHDPFGSVGFKLKKHIYLSPRDKKILLKKRKRVGDITKNSIPKERQRIISVHKHEDEYIGNIQHKTHDNHPIDSNFYTLEKIKKVRKQNE